MDTFKVGEIAIGQNFITSVECNGMECEIIGGLEMRGINRCNGVPCEKYFGMRYKVRWADGYVSGVKENLLRKKKPPKEEDKYDGNEIVSWDECIWRPEEICQ